MNSGLLNDRISTQQHLGRNSNWLWRRKNPTSHGTNCFTGDIHILAGAGAWSRHGRSAGRVSWFYLATTVTLWFAWRSMQGRIDAFVKMCWKATSWIWGNNYVSIRRERIRLRSGSQRSLKRGTRASVFSWELTATFSIYQTNPHPRPRRVWSPTPSPPLIHNRIVD